MKNSAISCLLCLLFLLNACAGAPTRATVSPSPTAAPMAGPSPTAPPTQPPQAWQLVWQDEFDAPAGTTPQAENWGYDLGGEGWGNQEWEYYTANAENATMDGAGHLVIRALALDEAQAAALSCWYGPCRYTSARLLTREKFEFTYGRVEARLKLPFGQGLWPAFWLLGSDIAKAGWPACGEIDIMEHIGREPSQVHGTVHGPGYSGASGIGFTYTLPTSQVFKDEFHVFALEWEPDELRWYVDGEQYGKLNKNRFSASKPWVFDHPFFIILNLAVGGVWPGYPNETTPFPQELLVDYVRVYQR